MVRSPDVADDSERRSSVDLIDHELSLAIKK